MGFLGRASSASSSFLSFSHSLRDATSVSEVSYHHAFSVFIDAGVLSSPVGYPNQGGSYDCGIQNRLYPRVWVRPERWSVTSVHLG